jgi:hypothetical protein
LLDDLHSLEERDREKEMGERWREGKRERTFEEGESQRGVLLTIKKRERV